MAPPLSLSLPLLLPLLLVMAAAAASAYQPPEPLPASVWVGSNESWFSYPEGPQGGNYSLPALLARPSLGVAVSGGGFRAATTGLGWLRALQLAGVLPHARYLSSNSGGSWLSGAFAFQRRLPEAEFLGPHEPPERLSLGAARESKPEGSFSRVLADAGILVPGAAGAVLDAARSLVPGKQQAGVGAWSATIGRAFLEPYGLNADDSTFTASGTAGEVHQAARALAPAGPLAVYTFHPEAPPAGNGGGGGSGANGSASAGAAAANGTGRRPMPVLMASLLLQEAPLGFFPFEFTPLYAGVPPFFNDTAPPIGGGLVDPLALNSPAPSPPLQLPPPIAAAFAAGNQTAPAGASAGGGNATAAGVTPGNASRLMGLEPLPAQVRPDFVVPLKVALGVSSSFITNMLRPEGRITRELTGTEVLRYWSPANATTDELLPFADGGSADNTAITPLLRRRVSKIIACVAASENASSARDAADWGGHQWDVAALFGAAPLQHPSYDDDSGHTTIVGVPADLFNRKLQVFPTEGFQRLFDATRSSTESGGPTFHQARYPVLANGYAAVPGGWEVDVLWVINQQQGKWEAALPEETRAALDRSRGSGEGEGGGGGLLGNIARGVGDVLSAAGVRGGAAEALGGLSGFPFISTGKADYPPELVALLSQMASWQMLALRPQLQQMLADVGVEVKPG